MLPDILKTAATALGVLVAATLFAVTVVTIPLAALYFYGDIGGLITIGVMFFGALFAVVFATIWQAKR